MFPLFTRLRWQLIASHLAVIAITLVLMVGAVVFVASGWIEAQQSSLQQPELSARIVAVSIGGLVTAGDPSNRGAELS